MSLLETVCALWLLACMATASAAAWGATLLAMQHTALAQIAQNCANNAAEEWMAGTIVAADYAVEGRSCHVEVAQDEALGVVQVSSVYAGVRYDLWIPIPAAT